MSWKFERIFDSDGTELTTAGMSTSISGAFDFCYDGRYLWVSAGSDGIGIYEFWGESSDHEPDFSTLDELTYPRYDVGLSKKLRLVTFLKISAGVVSRVTRLAPQKEDNATVYTLPTLEKAYYKATDKSAGTLNACYMAYANGKVYVTNGATFSQIYEFDPQTQNFLRTISVSETYTGADNEFFTKNSTYGMNSNLCSAGNKIWFVGSSWGDGVPQRLYCFDPATSAKTTTDIPVRPTRARTWIADGLNGYVYITNYNNVSVSKFRHSDAGFVGVIRVNALPTRIFSGQDRRIWVSSYGGMISLIDYDDDGVHNSWGSEFSVLSAAIDPTDASKLWWVRNDGVLARMDLNTNARLQTVVKPTKTLETTEVGVGGSLQTQAILGTAKENDIVHVTNPKTEIKYEYVAVPFDTTLDTYQWQFTGEVPENGLRDWNFSHSKLDKPELITFTPTITYTDGDGANHTVNNYMFLLQDGKLLAVRMNKYLYRDVFAEINGQAAVVAGSLGYFGE